MKRIISILLALNATLLLAKEAEEKPEFMTSFSFQGIQYVFSFYASDLTSSSDWDMGTTEPAILPNDAYKRARNALTALIPAMQDAATYEVVLMRQRGVDGKLHAFYNIYFDSPSLDKDPKAPPSCVTTARIGFTVLMDGRVISPKRYTAKESEPGAAPKSHPR